eukprot:8151068-Pyramimonas_sp.AAC.1
MERAFSDLTTACVTSAPRNMKGAASNRLASQLSAASGRLWKGISREAEMTLFTPPSLALILRATLAMYCARGRRGANPMDALAITRHCDGIPSCTSLSNFTSR